MSELFFFTPQQKEIAEQTSLVAFLLSQGEALKPSGSEWEWLQQGQKVTIRGNLWYHQYEQVGGDAVAFVRKFLGLGYIDAVEYLLRFNGEPIPGHQLKENKPFTLPQANENMNRVFAYLVNQRGIRREVVYAFVHKVKKNDDRPQYYVENSHPPIVSKEIFDRVQEEIARRNNKRKVKEVGTTTETGKYSGKYALTELLICGHCGTPYRRCTWTAHGRKRIVWRCISRLDYGRKYCENSPTIEETILQEAIVGAIRDLAAESSLGSSTGLLKSHIGIYFGGDNSIAADEMRAKELVAKITAAAGSGSYTGEMAAMVSELNAIKQRIAEKRQKSKASETALQRMSDIMESIDSISDSAIQYNDTIVRRLIECIRVISADEIEIVFKGMQPRRYPLK